MGESKKRWKGFNNCVAGTKCLANAKIGLHVVQ